MKGISKTRNRQFCEFRVACTIIAFIGTDALANRALSTIGGLPIIAPMRLLRLSGVLFLAAISTNAATLTGTIRDSGGAIIPNAFITVHWDSGSSNGLDGKPVTQKDVTATSDSKGQFSLELPAGIYDVFATAAAFSPHCDKIRLKDKEVKIYDIKLKIGKFAPKVFVSFSASQLAEPLQLSEYAVNQELSKFLSELQIPAFRKRRVQGF